MNSRYFIHYYTVFIIIVNKYLLLQTAVLNLQVSMTMGEARV